MLKGKQWHRKAVKVKPKIKLKKKKQELAHVLSVNLDKESWRMEASCLWKNLPNSLNVGKKEKKKSQFQTCYDGIEDCRMAFM